MRPFILILLISSLTLHARTWVNAEGKQLEAELLKIKEDSVSLRMKANRKVYEVKINDLSEADQKYISLEREKGAEEEKASALEGRKAKWHEKYDDAVQESMETGLPLLIFFTGSDWCGYCVKLKKEVFEDRKFKSFADESLVLFVADFPKRKKQRSSIQKQNNELKKQFSISGYPTIFLTNEKVEQFSKFGGYGGDARDYVKKLESAIESLKE